VKEFVRKAMLQREKEPQEWLKKAKATVEKSNSMHIGLLDGTAKVALGDGEEEWDSEFLENVERSDCGKSVSGSNHTTNHNGSNGGNSNANKTSAIRGYAPLWSIAKMRKTLGRWWRSGLRREGLLRYATETGEGDEGLGLSKPEFSGGFFFLVFFNFLLP
jgi:hypothetical protein